jgi:hypothetical protein
MFIRHRDDLALVRKVLQQLREPSKVLLIRYLPVKENLNRCFIDRTENFRHIHSRRFDPNEPWATSNRKTMRRRRDQRMRGYTTLTILTLAAFTAALCVTPVRAADSCQPIFAALMKVATTPSHSYTTSTPVNGGNSMESETIFADGQKYIRARGKWMRLPVTSQDVVEQEKEKEQHGKSTCQLLRSESVNGEAAMLYSVHREYEEVKEDGQIWVSKSTGLPLRAEEDFDNKSNKGKEHRSARFEYSNIRPPV